LAVLPTAVRAMAGDLRQVLAQGKVETVVGQELKLLPYATFGKLRGSEGR